MSPGGRRVFSRQRSRAMLAMLAIANLGFAAAVIVLEYGGLGHIGPPEEPPAFPDFTAFWAAAVMTLDGTPALAYDWAAHKAVEVTGIGFTPKTWMPWHYPPHFQLAVTPFGTLPFWWSMAVWLVLTIALYLWTAWRILPDALGTLGALAAAPTAMILVNGQTGFLTGALLGIVLLELERRPTLSGAALGLISFKPHLGLALPVMLAIERRWRVLAVATAVFVATVALSWVTLGTETWAAFIASITETTTVFRGNDGRFEIYASFYGWLRHIGVAFAPAIAAHGVLALATLAATVVAWRSERVSFAVKAALLCYCVAIFTPRILYYDLHFVVIGALFQARHAVAAGFLRGESALLGAALALGFVFMLFATMATFVLAPALFAFCWLGRVRGAARADTAVSAP